MWSSDKPSASPAKANWVYRRDLEPQSQRSLNCSLDLQCNWEWKEDLRSLFFWWLQIRQDSTKRRQNRKRTLKKFASVIKVLKMVNEVVPFIGKELRLSDEAQSKFDNPYSLAQLYNLIETERNGFSKVPLCRPLRKRLAHDDDRRLGTTLSPPLRTAFAHSTDLFAKPSTGILGKLLKDCGRS